MLFKGACKGALLSAFYFSKKSIESFLKSRLTIIGTGYTNNVLPISFWEEIMNGVETR